MVAAERFSREDETFSPGRRCQNGAVSFRSRSVEVVIGDLSTVRMDQLSRRCIVTSFHSFNLAGHPRKRKRRTRLFCGWRYGPAIMHVISRVTSNLRDFVFSARDSQQLRVCLKWAIVSSWLPLRSVVSERTRQGRRPERLRRPWDPVAQVRSAFDRLSLKKTAVHDASSEPPSDAHRTTM